MHLLPFTRLLNDLFGGFALALLHALGIQPHGAPIPNYVAMEILVALLLIAFFIAVKMSLSVEGPGPLQHTIEGIYGFIDNLSQEIVGHHSAKFVPYLMVLGMFILTSNLLGLIPGMETPTMVPAVPLGCALLTWVYYHYQGIRENGTIGYLKHFIGPQEGMPVTVRIMLPVLMFPIEIFSHTARVLSLTVRLYANMFAGEMVTLVFFSLVPIGIPLLFQGLHIGVSFIQTYIFVLLACVYLGEATAHEH